MLCSNCPDWEEEVPKIDGPILFIETTRPHMSYGKVKVFVYCPWCGRKLVSEDDKIVMCEV